ncbi:MAG: lytic murein transglycosylase [Mesorhizobium sp.]|nr:lytic murein transglycosylase [Mesorhizobium sp. M4A.F.Ca.ET.090.04.2.1]RWC52624.1 MAG: lytic murein transglycosylase [Mesorhizobium sp.]RWD14514.1 MAG: lytic murein transglycosylase [Mesorhizobium sp.]RWD55985.1 MAG: lytic murein transglycosylase [Mesorhizobium sp.]TIU70548.1 MAG: lytic murein transglycosylase [Mesorhizobium sp.]
MAFLPIPLCPAGHLPLKGGDRMSRRLSPVSDAAEKAAWPKLPISPLEGEMAGRPEGGAWARPLQSMQQP